MTAQAVTARLMTRVGGETRILTTWDCPIGGVPPKGDLIGIGDEIRRIRDRIWRGPFFVQLVLSEPYDTDDPCGITESEETP